MTAETFLSRPALLFTGLLAVSGCATTEESLNLGYVTDFESCLAGGNPVLEGSPRRCLENGQLFVERR